MPINPIVNGAHNIASGQVAIGTSATLIVTRRNSRRSIGILNSGSNTIYIGGPTVTTACGHELPSGSFVGLPTVTELWGIGGSASSVTYIEAYD
jgi:hypothetical protein